MRTLLFLLVASSLFGQTSNEKEAIAAVQRLFDAMKSHDAEALRSLMLPEARLYSIRGQGAPASTPVETFVNQIVNAKGELLERFTGLPQISVRGPMAQVWGEYEFLRDGKFTHCGVDTAILFRTAEGWKIASLAYTVETTGCKGR